MAKTSNKPVRGLSYKTPKGASPKSSYSNPAKGKRSSKASAPLTVDQISTAKKARRF